MGASRSKMRAERIAKRRHEWQRVQELPAYTDDYSEQPNRQELDEEYVEEKANWPSTCPVLHLDIKNDFILDAHRRLISSLYRFWLFIFWASVLNFLGVMAAQLTAFITSGETLVLAFTMAVLAYFFVFFFYFRTLYWAIRLDSNVLYVWFYIMSFIMWGYYAFTIVTAVTLMSILSSPLAPGTQLPVKINPIFPMIVFTLVIFCFLLAIVYGFHYFSQAFKWHGTSDEQIYELLRKQKKQGWMRKWFKNGGDGGGDGDDKDNAFKCMLQYEQLNQDGSTVKKKNKKTRDVLTVPGVLSFDDTETGFFATFKADEAVFAYVFSLKVWLQGVKSVKKEGEDTMKIIEQVNDQVPEVFNMEYTDIPAGCMSKAQTVRVIILDFDDKASRDKCFKEFNKKWKRARKSKMKEASESTLESLRVGLLRRSAERSAKHLLTLRDWQELLKFAWRREYKAGEVIMECGQHFEGLMHISSGNVDVYLETSAKTDAGGSSYAGDSDMEDVIEVLFPGMKLTEDAEEGKAADLSLKAEMDAVRSNTDLFYSVTFEKREMQFFKYQIEEIQAKGEQPKHVAIVSAVRSRSQAGKAHVRQGDYIKKIGLFDVDKNIEILFSSNETRNENEIRRRIDGALNSFPCPFVVQFYRPPATLPPPDDGLDLYGVNDETEQIQVVVVGKPEAASSTRSFSFETSTDLGDDASDTTTIQQSSYPGIAELEMAERFAERGKQEDEETVEFLARDEFSTAGVDDDVERVVHKPSTFVKGVNRVTGLGRANYEPVGGNTAKSGGGIVDQGSKALLFGLTSLKGLVRSKPVYQDEDTEYEPVENEAAELHSDTDTDDSSNEGLQRLFDATSTFENVGNFAKGDTLGLVPWIVNHPVSVVQLIAHTDVTLHTIELKDIIGVLRKDSTLAIGFFKYVASVIGERADKDEEELCKQLENGTAAATGRVQRERLCRLLDNKPINLTTDTYFEERASWMKNLRRFFETDSDMEFDSLVEKVPSVRVQVLSEYDNPKTEKQPFKQGALYITMHYVCFRNKQKNIKLHLNDIFEARRDENLLMLAADKVRLEIMFLDAPTSSYIHDLVQVMTETTSVEKAPLSYTLKGDYFSRENPGVIEETEVLASLFEQQRGLRADLLVLMETLEGVLTKRDRVKLFRDGQSVTLKKNQNVTTAIKSIREVTTEDPNGLYLLGNGELVVQREVNGKRIQFASYTKHAVFGIERFLTGAPSPCTIKVLSKTATLKFAPFDRCMTILRNDPPLAARFYQYCTLTHMKRLRGPVLSRPVNDADLAVMANANKGTRGCVIL